MYCQRDPLFAGKVIKMPIHLWDFYYINVMLNEKLKVAVVNVCIKGTVEDDFHYCTDFTEVWILLKRS